MSALTGKRTIKAKGSNTRLRIFTLLVKAGTAIFEGAAVGVDPATGYAEPMNGTNNALVAYGVADHDAHGDGTDGLPTEVIVRPGVYPMTSSGLGFIDVGKAAYATSDQDVSTSSNSGARPVMGTIDHVESATVAWVAIEPPNAFASIAAADIDATVALQKRSVTVGHAGLTAAATSEAINIGAVLPANARILGVSIALATAFSGGGAGAVSVDIGTSGDVDAIIDGANLFAAAVDGQASTRPLGIAPNKLFASAGAQLLATFISDVNVADLTAGSATIDVLFSVLA